MLNKHLPQQCDEPKALLYQYLHSSPPVWSAQVLDSCCSGAGTIHILILYKQTITLVGKSNDKHLSYPVKYYQTHSHIKSCSREVDTLWQVSKELVVKRFNPVSVPTLQFKEYMYMIIIGTLSTLSILTRQKSLA